MTFCLSAGLLAPVFFTLSAICAVCTRKEERLARWEPLPRSKYPGIALTVLVIFWCVPNIRPILEPDSSLQDWLIPLGIAAVILCAVFLDFLFARALAAFAILLAHGMLKLAYAAVSEPWLAFFAVALLLLGIAGMFVAAKPYYLREWIRALFRKQWVRAVSSAFFAYAGASALAAALAAWK